MKLLGISQIIVLITLYGLTLAADLPKLAHNKLLEGKHRDIPNATPIKCEPHATKKFKVKKTKDPGSVLTNKIFSRDAFTSGPISGPGGPKPAPGPGSKYRFAELHGDKVLYALIIHHSGEAAYWLPQGGTIDIPRKPKHNEPKYVFTPDFSGCSWTVTPMANGMLRLRHVEGSKEEAFNKLTDAQKGGSVTYGIQFKDYGYIKNPHGSGTVRNDHGVAYMNFNEVWTFYLQCKTCCPDTGGYVYDKKKILKELIMNQAKQKTYPPISGTKTYTIPH